MKISQSKVAKAKTKKRPKIQERKVNMLCLLGILAASRQKYKLQQVAKETLNHCNSVADGFGCLARAHIVCEALNKQTK